MSAGNNFDINAHLAQMGFGQKSDGGGGSGEAMTPDKVIPKGIDKAFQTLFKIAGVKVNPDIEGKSAMAGFEVEGVGSGFSPTNLSLMKDLQGAGPLGMFASIFKYFTRDIPQLFTGGEGGDLHAHNGSGEGGSGDSHAGSSGGGGHSDGGGGHSDHGGMPGAGNYAAAADMPEMKDYGGKMMASADVPMEDLGNLRPSAASAGAGRSDLGGGMSM